MADRGHLSEPGVLEMDPAEIIQLAERLEHQAASYRLIAHGIYQYRGEIPPGATSAIVGSVVKFVRGVIAKNGTAKASELRRAAGGSKAVDAALRSLVDRGEIERLGGGWYRSVEIKVAR